MNLAGLSSKGSVSRSRADRTASYKGLASRANVTVVDDIFPPGLRSSGLHDVQLSKNTRDTRLRDKQAAVSNVIIANQK
jgi:hypothetical protein